MRKPSHRLLIGADTDLGGEGCGLSTRTCRHSS